MCSTAWDSQEILCPKCGSERVRTDWDLPEEDRSIDMISMKVQFLVDPLRVKARCPECEIEFKAKFKMKDVVALE